MSEPFINEVIIFKCAPHLSFTEFESGDGASVSERQ
jgi:hypothetical protein